VYEPGSFDLADAEGIKSKARSWLGHLSAVADDVEPFKPHFIVGAPATEGLEDAYRSALAILRKAPNHPEIYEESEVDDFVAKIDSAVLTPNIKEMPNAAVSTAHDFIEQIGFDELADGLC
jgi:hypothetical protein